MIFIVYYPTYTLHFAETLLNMQYRRNIGDIIIPPLLKSTLKNPPPPPQIPFPPPRKTPPTPEKRPPPPKKAFPHPLKMLPYHPQKMLPTGAQGPPFYHVCFEGIYLNQKVFMELFLFLFYFESVP